MLEHVYTQWGKQALHEDGGGEERAFWRQRSLEEVIEDVEVTLGVVPSWKSTEKPAMVIGHHRRPKNSLVAQTWSLWQVGELGQR